VGGSICATRVKDAEKAAKIYGGAFGAEISGRGAATGNGVLTRVRDAANTKIELISRAARPRRSPNSSSAMQTAASSHLLCRARHHRGARP